MSLITYHNMRKIASVIFFCLLRNVEKSNFLLYSFSKSSCILRWPQKKNQMEYFLKTRVGIVKKKEFCYYNNYSFFAKEQIDIRK